MRRSTRNTAPSLKAREADGTKSMATNTLTQKAGVKKPAGKPKKVTAKGKTAATKATGSSQKPKQAASKALAASTAFTSKTKTATGTTYQATEVSSHPKSAKAAGKAKATEKAPTPKDAPITAQTKAVGKSKPTEKSPTSKNDPLTAQTKARVKKDTTPAPLPKINERPTQILNVFVCGEGSNSELGLGTAKKAIDVKRPRLNPLLGANDVKVVNLEAGGMHSLALTSDGTVLSWGVNDNQALGRPTEWDGGLKDIDDNKSDSGSDDDSGLNPRESNPGKVEFPPGVEIVKVAAGDSISLALTDDGKVYGWGTFRNQSGVLGFYQEQPTTRRRADPSDEGWIQNQDRPRLYEEISDAVDIKAGANHCMALTSKGMIYIWGGGEQNQLGHHINERIDIEGRACLIPKFLRTGRRKHQAIFTGNDHSFAQDINGNIWSWGLNAFGATGITEGAGEDNAAVYVPTKVNSLNNAEDPVRYICGGQHHTIAITQSGAALSFGRVDGQQSGLDLANVPPEDIIYDAASQGGKPRIVTKPTAIPNVGHATFAAAGVDHSILINAAGRAYSWGIGVNYQLGLGSTNDQDLPALVDNTAVRDQKLTWAGCGGQFSMLAAPVDPMDIDGEAGPSGS